MDERRSGSFLSAVAALLTLVLVGTTAFSRGAHASSLADMKASYLLNFARLVDWPETGKDRNGSPFVVCGFPDDPVIDALRRQPTRSVGGRPLHIRTSGSGFAMNDCDLAYWPGSVPFPREGIALPGVLIVVDSDAGFRAGAVIAYHVEDQKLRFSIDVENARQHGFVINARLLKLARIHGASR